MMETALPTYVFALALGLFHAFEADHIVAVTTLVARTHGMRNSSLLGALWGAGHATTLLIVGFFLLMLRISIPATLSTLFESLVAGILIALGASTIRKVMKREIHAHAHTHGLHAHAHLHVHKTISHNHHAPFLVGLFHGLAGSGALALAAVAVSKTLIGGLSFIVLFGFGSAIGMTLLSASFGFIMKHAVRFVRVHTALMLGSGALCIAVALTLLPLEGMLGMFVK
jgi:high-affinity nickel permease